MSMLRIVPETWELDGDDARETLLRARAACTLVRDSFVRFRAADGFSHARSLAFLVSLVLVQGVIGLVGLASSLGEDGLERDDRRGPSARSRPDRWGGRSPTRCSRRRSTGSSGKWVALVFGLSARSSPARR